MIATASLQEHQPPSTLHLRYTTMSQPPASSAPPSLPTNQNQSLHSSASSKPISRSNKFDIIIPRHTNPPSSPSKTSQTVSKISLKMDPPNAAGGGSWGSQQEPIEVDDDTPSVPVVSKRHEPSHPAESDPAEYSVLQPMACEWHQRDAVLNTAKNAIQVRSSR